MCATKTGSETKYACTDAASGYGLDGGVAVGNEVPGVGVRVVARCVFTFKVYWCGCAAQLRLVLLCESGEVMALFVLQIGPDQAQRSPAKPNHVPTFTSHN